MTIGFHNVTPAPLAGVIDFKTDVWQKECVFEHGLRYNIVAPSGKGKTTFMHSIYGLRYDYAGDIRIGDADVRSLKADEWTDLRRDQLSIVYQDLRLFIQLTARENIQVKAALYGALITDTTDEMAEVLGVTNVLDKPCHTLSYGERQRIAIIRALIQPFTWLLLDEPFSHLDKENARKAAALMTEACLQRKAGMIITSHGADDYFIFDHKYQL